MGGLTSPRDAVLRLGTATLYRMRAEGVDASLPPLFLVPSMINRAYVLDLREGASLAAAVASASPRRAVYLLDWGIPEDEDRYTNWDEVIAKLARFARAVRRHAGARKIAVLGYCMGGTLSSIYAALNPEEVCALIDLAGPIDFSHAGLLGELVDAKHFDASAIVSAGNLAATQMQSGFLALRPTGSIAKWVGFADKAHDELSREAFFSLEEWASDNIPFPGAAYETYIGDLYQKNALVKGEHRVLGERVDLGRIKCPVMVVVAERDAICPKEAATALLAHVGSKTTKVMSIPGGHVGAVVGSRAQKVLYPGISEWLAEVAGPRASAVATA